jgi:hypothetical protein
MFTPDEDIQGDEARIYWLTMLFDEIAGEMDNCMTTGTLTKSRFDHVLKKFTAIANVAYISNGAKISHEEN